MPAVGAVVGGLIGTSVAAAAGLGTLGTIAATALGSGLGSVATGGKFGPAAVSGGLGALGGGLGAIYTGSTLGQMAGSALGGALGSKLGGGDPLTGAAIGGGLSALGAFGGGTPNFFTSLISGPQAASSMSSSALPGGPATPLASASTSSALGTTLQNAATNILGKLGSAENLLGAGLSYLQQKKYSDQLANISRQMMQVADPFAAYRPAMAADLSALVRDPSRVQSLPSYQFAQDEAARQLMRQASARGLVDAGATRSALARLAEQTAKEYYDSEVSKLATLSGATTNPAAAAYVGLQPMMQSAMSSAQSLTPFGDILNPFLRR